MQYSNHMHIEANIKYALSTQDKYHILIEIWNVGEIRKGMVRDIN